MLHKTSELNNKSNYIRKEVIDISVRNGAGHIAPSLSCVEILTALYYSVMTYDQKNPSWDGRDRLIFSKAHGCYALYAILADIGIIPKSEWLNFYKGSGLSGCSERKLSYGIEAGCGSLGHGLPIAVGTAFGARKLKMKYHVFCVVGDGELQEGTTWEAIQFAVKHELDNLTIVVDFNGLQAMDLLVNILDRTKMDLIGRLKGFGLSPKVCPGHNVQKLVTCLGAAKTRRDLAPSVVVAKTVKGYGVRCMENVPKFHFRIPTSAELRPK